MTFAVNSRGAIPASRPVRVTRPNARASAYRPDPAPWHFDRNANLDAKNVLVGTGRCDGRVDAGGAVEHESTKFVLTYRRAEEHYPQAF